MEEIVISKNSWFCGHKLKDAHLRDKLKVSIIGITEEEGKFIQMPEGDTIINSGCKLLVVGNQSGIYKARNILNKLEKPEECEV